MVALTTGFAQIVNGILEEYQRRGHNVEALPISVDVLRDIVQERCELTTLAIQEVDINSESVYGQIKFWRYYTLPTPQNAC